MASQPNITRAALRKLKVPSERPYSYGKTSDRWAPIQHGELADLFMWYLLPQCELISQRWYLMRSGNALVGTVRCEDATFFLRHSNDGFWAPTIYWGAAGIPFGSVQVSSKHAASVDMTDRLGKAVDAAIAEARMRNDRIESKLAGLHVGDHEGVAMLCDLPLAGVTSWLVVRAAQAKWLAGAGRNGENNALVLLCCLRDASAERNPVHTLETMIRATRALGEPIRSLFPLHEESHAARPLTTSA